MPGHSTVGCLEMPPAQPPRHTTSSGVQHTNFLTAQATVPAAGDAIILRSGTKCVGPSNHPHHCKEHKSPGLRPGCGRDVCMPLRRSSRFRWLTDQCVGEPDVDSRVETRRSHCPLCQAPIHHMAAATKGQAPNPCSEFSTSQAREGPVSDSPLGSSSPPYNDETPSAGLVSCILY